MLIFKYCECGCKGSLSIRIGSAEFWLFDNLKGPVYLHRGHGYLSPLIKQCSSYNEAVQLATDEAKVLLDIEQKNLDEVRRQINAKPPKVLSFEQELRAQFPGKESAGIRQMIRKANSSEKIRLLAKSVAFTELSRTKLEIVAEAFDRQTK